MDTGLTPSPLPHTGLAPSPIPQFTVSKVTVPKAEHSYEVSMGKFRQAGIPCLRKLLKNITSNLGGNCQRLSPLNTFTTM